MTDTTDQRTQYQHGLVKNVTAWTEEVFTIQVQTDPMPAFDAGQYLSLAMHINNEIVARPYSIASAPSSTDMEFYLTASTDDQYSGLLSSQLRTLQQGDALLLGNRAHGFLTMHEVPQAKNIWLFASGVGLAPFLSIIRHGEIFHKYHSVILVHSVRYVNELGYHSQLQQLAQDNTHFRYLPCITRQPGKADWISVRMTDALTNGLLESRAKVQIHPRNSQCMLCGNPAMIDECIALLRARGLRRNRRRTPGHITVEKFW